jgi:microcystin degradation protein MlrC
LNILFLAFGHGGNSFSSSLTGSGDFRIRTDDFVSSSLRRAANELEVHVVPVIHCWAPSGGPIDQDSYRYLLDLVHNEFQGALSETPQVDAVLLHLHGAMAVEGCSTSEVDFIRDLKSIAGETVPFAAAFDLHGNLSIETIAQLDVIRSYRTAPHEDVTATLVEVLRQLYRVISEGIVTQRAFLKMPLLIPEAYAITAREPFASLMSKVEKFDRTPGIISASIFTGFPWANSPAAGASVVVLGDDAQIVRSVAISLAQELWKIRRDIFADVAIYEVGDALKVAEAPGSFVFVLDTGDNISAGAPGSRVELLQAFLSAGVAGCLFVPIFDENFCKKAIELGPGSVVSGRLGEKGEGSPGIEISGLVKLVKEGAHVLMDVSGVEILVTSKRIKFDSLAKFNHLGIDIDRYQAVVFKLGYLSAELYRRSARVLVVASEGCATLDFAKLDFSGVQRPIFPLDASIEFDCEEATTTV